jgi:hypothetical protein
MNQHTQIKGHRFRTHLATIVSSVELLQHYAAQCTQAERDALLREIGAAAGRMREMLDEAAQAQEQAQEHVQWRPSPVAANESPHG